MSIRVAVDAMGGDHAPEVVVEGAVRAVKEAAGEIEVVLVGPEDRLRQDLTGIADALPIQVVHAPEVIEMSDAPAAAVKGKPNSSIHIGLGLHKQGMAQAFASAGNTGAVMGASLFILGRQENVARPSVVGFYPTLEGFTILIDVGTNVDCKPEHLLQFAVMGSIYARNVLKRENPSVALMNVGEEPGKGNEQVKQAYDLLSRAEGINFIGNVEGRDVLGHAADVIVCDGFVGNIMLKLGESVATTFPKMVQREIVRQGIDGAGIEVVKNVLGGVQRRFDYTEYGGAPLLGVNGNVIIGHGSSNARAIERMIFAAAELVKGNVADSIAATLNR